MISLKEPAHTLDAQQDMSLGKLLDGYAEVSPDEDRPIRRLAINSRDVEYGDVFFAMPGTQEDGRNYIDHALERQAAAVVYEKTGTKPRGNQGRKTPVLAIEGLRDVLGAIASRYYDHPARKIRVLGVTGTNGKTTVAYLIAQALDYLGIPCAYLGTIGTGRVGNLKHASLTTSDSIRLHSMLSEIVQARIPALSMEVSSHGLDQGRVNGVNFEIGIFTNLSHDHLDYHGTIERYGQAKHRLFEYPGMLAMVVNTDDAFGREIVDYCRAETRARCFTYGFNPDAGLCPTSFGLGAHGTVFDLDLEGVSTRFESKLIGRFNILNLLATIGALQAFGMSTRQIVAAIRDIQPPPGRMELLQGGDRWPSVVVDYAHTPDALKHALSSLRELCKGKLVAVFGCGGERDTDKRPFMGAIAEEYADHVILTNDNPRRETPEKIIEGIVSGMRSSPEICLDRGKAIQIAIEMSTQSDLVLIAGKGHENSQVTGNTEREFNDSSWVREQLQEAGT
ncbi:MAG: UDP-N-acetylmuramoyl-L-alanyl-D-glutamate--2,6-diaminopimelate ligase [Gammaproteobacteria bacterium]|nr:UDP-N-acetylmuramoyl-L-alanyl-D-glutamate--2,6-diaminopimelate ligase [Gammaproteobacteria bacterium]